MIISKNSQLGLMMEDVDIQVEFIKIMQSFLESKIGKLDELRGIVETLSEYDFEKSIEGVVNINTSLIDDKDVKDFLFSTENWRQVEKKVSDKFSMSIEQQGVLNFIDNKDSKLYLICEGVDKCSKMIRIGDNFTSKALKNVEFGKHTYLLGKTEMTRFLCTRGAIKGVYWNREKNIGFEYGFDIENDGYYFDERYPNEFNKIAKIMTFVELGDIEILMLEKGRNNGKAKKEDKITNTSNYTVYVVDSSWNKLIIRTDGFAVMGHFRLQPCGVNHADRKLIWINAFEKHGYVRRPRGEIIHT